MLTSIFHNVAQRCVRGVIKFMPILPADELGKSANEPTHDAVMRKTGRPLTLFQFSEPPVYYVVIRQWQKYEVIHTGTGGPSLFLLAQ